MRNFVMRYENQLKTLTIKNFKSIKNVEDLSIKELNILIGNNTTGKKDFIQYLYSLDTLHIESFYFKDLSKITGKKGPQEQHSDFLESDGSNLGSYLYRLSSEAPDAYDRIQRTVRLAYPMFDKFIFKSENSTSGSQQIYLFWKQVNSEIVLWPNQLSKGLLSLFCLATALLQPNPPAVIIIEKAEANLYPYAQFLLGALLKSSSKRMQVVISTESKQLINEFQIEDCILVSRIDDYSTLKRLSTAKGNESWLNAYSIV